MEDKKLFEQCEELFANRHSLINLWQEIATNFYPERADFIYHRTLGTDFASNITTSYPVLIRRDLGNYLSFMLRPIDKLWFRMVVGDSELKDADAKAWLQQAANIQRRAMYDRASLFIRATKEGDHDFVSFGQCVISIEMNKNKDALLYRCWHLRDMAWQENEEGKIAQVFRKWKPKVRDLVRIFGAGKVHPETVKTADKQPFMDADIRHMVVEADLADGDFNTPYVSIYYDAEHNCTIEKVGITNMIYVIPRWQTVSGTQYSFSPATVAGLPDGRLLQAMTYTLLEAGEKHANPPMIAVQEAIRSDVSVYAGGITWVDAAYDERLGEVLRPLTQDKSGMPMGVDMMRDVRGILRDAFYLDKLTMPERAPEMTAYEVGQRIQQYIRDALPLFEPMELEYNGAICERTFELLFRHGAFGSPFDIPKSLRGADLQFRFESPLHEAIEREKGNRFLEAQQFIASAVQLDPTTAFVVDAAQALRDALDGVGIPTNWLNSPEKSQALQQNAQRQQQLQTGLANLQQGGEAAKAIGEAQQSFGNNTPTFGGTPG